MKRDPSRFQCWSCLTALRGVQLAVTLPTIFFLASSAVAAEVSSTTSTHNLQVAEAFTLDIKVLAAKGAKVTFPTTPEKLGEFDVRDTYDAFDVPTPSGRSWTRRLTLESIVTGELKIPSIEIKVTENGESKSLETQPIAIRVASVLEDRSDPTKFRDIQTVVDLQIPQTPSYTWLWLATGGVCALGALAFVGLWVTRRNRWKTPDAWAVEELDKLQSSVHSQPMDSETVIERASEIVRSYLSLEYGIQDSGRTPQELVDALLQSHRIEKQRGDDFAALFAIASQAKFAGLDLAPEELLKTLQDFRLLIQQRDNHPNATTELMKP